MSVERFEIIYGFKRREEKHEMLQLEAKENLILKACREASETIYIYAAGTMAKRMADGLLHEQIPVAGFLVDPDYWREGESYRDIPILNIEETNLSDDDLVIIAKQWYDESKVAHIRMQAKTIVMDMTSFFFTDDNPDYGFVEKNLELFENTYDMLADDKSRRHMRAWLNQKISGDFKYLEDIWEENQYFDSDIVDFTRIHAFVDCGAYDGDSYRSFLENYKRNVGCEFAGIAYLLEPESYEMCLLKCGEDKRCKIYPLGAWEEKDSLSFSAQGTTSMVSKDGANIINVDTIDHILGGGADFIKMDIEGSELNALKGARNTIIANKPTLAICAYHRTDDLLKLPEYIGSLCPDYKFYLRAHCKYTTELVLYATV